MMMMRDRAMDQVAELAGVAEVLITMNGNGSVSVWHCLDMGFCSLERFSPCYYVNAKSLHAPCAGTLLDYALRKYKRRRYSSVQCD